MIPILFLISTVPTLPMVLTIVCVSSVSRTFIFVSWDAHLITSLVISVDEAMNVDGQSDQLSVDVNVYVSPNVNTGSTIPLSGEAANYGLLCNSFSLAVHTLTTVFGLVYLVSFCCQ